MTALRLVWINKVFILPEETASSEELLKITVPTMICSLHPEMWSLLGELEFSLETCSQPTSKYHDVIIFLVLTLRQCRGLTLVKVKLNKSKTKE